MALSQQEKQHLLRLKGEGKTFSESMSLLGAARTGRASIPQQAPSSTYTQQFEQAEKEGRATDFLSDIKAGFSGAVEAVDRGVDRIDDVNERKGFFSRGLGRFAAGTRTAGEALGSIGEGLFRALPGGTKAADTAEKVIGAGIEKGVESAQAIDQATGERISGAFEELPEGIKQTVGDIGNIVLGGAGIGGAVVAPGVMSKITNTAVKKSLEEANSAFEAVRKIETPTLKPISESGVSKLVKDFRFNLSDIDPQVENVIKSSSFDDVNKYFQSAKNASGNIEKPMPTALAAEKAELAFNTYNQAIQKAVDGKKRLLGEVATVKMTPDSFQEASDFFNKELQDRFSATLDADGNVTGISSGTLKLDSKDAGLIQTYLDKLNQLGETPTVKQVDDFVDYAQKTLYKQTSPNKYEVADDKVVSFLKQTTGIINDSVKKTADNGYAEVNAQISNLIDRKEALNSLLGDEGVKGAQLMKKLFSPAGEGVRRAFEDVKSDLGIDLFKEATLAKFAMETAGDVRQKSLLKQLDVAVKEAADFDLTKPMSIINFIRERTDLDGQELANQIIRRQQKE